MRGAIIALSGVDCSGKSTQIDLLSQQLARAGHDPLVVWYRPGYSKWLDGLRGLVRKTAVGAIPAPGDGAARSRVFASPGVARTWALVALVDSLLHYALLVRWHALRGRAVICDRFVEDAVLDLTLRFPALGVEAWLLTSALRRFAPTPDARVLLTIDEPEQLRRMQAKNEPFPDPADVRLLRFKAYSHFGSLGYEVVDGSRPREVVCTAIVASLRRSGIAL